MKRITHFLWFNDQAEEAAKFYVSVFPKKKLGRNACYSTEAAAASGRPIGSAMTVSFRLNGGPAFTFTPAISFVVNCDTQREIDRLWEKLSTGGEPGQCGWLKDKYRVSWQIVPAGCCDLFAMVTVLHRPPYPKNTPSKQLTAVLPRSTLNHRMLEVHRPLIAEGGEHGDHRSPVRAA